MRGLRRSMAVAGAALVLVAGGATAPTVQTRPVDYFADHCLIAKPSVKPSSGTLFWLAGPHFELSFGGSQVSAFDDDIQRPAAGHEFLCVSKKDAGAPIIGPYKIEDGDKVS